MRFEIVRQIHRTVGSICSPPKWKSPPREPGPGQRVFCSRPGWACPIVSPGGSAAPAELIRQRCGSQTLLGLNAQTPTYFFIYGGARCQKPAPPEWKVSPKIPAYGAGAQSNPFRYLYISGVGLSAGRLPGYGPPSSSRLMEHVRWVVFPCCWALSCCFSSHCKGTGICLSGPGFFDHDYPACGTIRGVFRKQKIGYMPGLARLRLGGPRASASKIVFSIYRGLI